MIHKTTRSILSVLLAALLLVTSIPLTPAFAGGGGVSLQSANNESRELEQVDGVYQIGSADELREFAELVNGGKTDANTRAVLTANIDLSSVCGPELNDGTSWTPIGNSSNNQYTGTFNGQNFKISGLYIDSNADCQGLFGYVSGSGKIEKLSVSGTVSGGMYVGGVVRLNNGSVEDCDFTGSVSGSYVGGVVGVNGGNVINCTNTGTVTGPESGNNNRVGGVVGRNDGSVKNCYNTGTVTGSGNSVGGVVGYNSGSSTVENCTNTGEVSGPNSGSDSNVGGVVGQNSGTVKNCYNTGAVSGVEEVGGVVGNNYNGSVENSYNTGAVSGVEGVGGVVGYNISSVTNCYNTGTVTGSGSYVGGVVGWNSSGGTVTDCYFLKDTAKKGIGSGSGSATPLTAEEFADQNEFSSWDFANTWEIKSIFGRPTLRDNAEIGGTANNPYKIFTATQLKNFATAVNDGSEKSAHAKLMNNIDLKDVCGESNSWIPIGNSEENAYTGTFNGAGHTISGLYIDRSANYQGLFGRVNGGTVQNLSVSGSVKGDDYVGGVVGQNGGTVENCYNTGAVNSSGNRVGGVVGYNSRIVKNCYNTGAVNSSGNWVGGVVGVNSGSVTNCYNTVNGTVTVTGNDYVGGVVGYNSSNGTVENCYNTVKVTGSSNYSYIGGVVGQNFGTVENCYNTGSVTVTGSDGRVGGVVGWNSGPVKNCYNTGTVSDGTGTDDCVGGVVGLNGGTVENCYNTGTVTGTDDYVGGVVGYNGSSSTIENCYYQQHDPAIFGIGDTTKDDTRTVAKTAEQFASGEVAWLLQNGQTAGEGEVVPLVWGQSNLKDKNSWPTLVALDKDAKPVYKVAFISDNTEIEAQYANSGMTVGSPTTNPTKEGYTFAGWFTKSSGGSQWNFSTAVTENMSLYAQWTAVEDPEPEPEEPPYTGKYSYELSTSVGDHGSLTVDRYATEGEKVTITVTPDEAYKLDDLSVTANGKDVELTANSDGTYTFTMPSADVRITATFAEDPDWTEPEEPATDVSDLFSDIAPDAWYKDAIQYAYDNGLMTGVSDTEFAPEATTTRAMIVSILARLEGVTTAQAAGFADVTDEWYATAVNWAANVGVVNGYEDNTFRPNTAITREQLAAILMNYAAYKGEDVSARADLANYTDQPSTWAQEAISWSVAEGLLTGVTADTLQPQGAATRAQVAAILQRFLSE